jgi:hypothetical protein
VASCRLDETESLNCAGETCTSQTNYSLLHAHRPACIRPHHPYPLPSSPPTSEHWDEETHPSGDSRVSFGTYWVLDPPPRPEPHTPFYPRLIRTIDLDDALCFSPRTTALMNRDRSLGHRRSRGLDRSGGILLRCCMRQVVDKAVRSPICNSRRPAQWISRAHMILLRNCTHSERFHPISPIRYHRRNRLQLWFA